MRSVPFTFLLATVLAAPGLAQKRSGPAKEPTFGEAVETARKAFDAQEHGAAVSALQAAIRAVQKLQRKAILEALPKPEGFTFEDQAQDETANPFAAGMAALGLTVQRRYQKGDDKSIDVEVTANSPMVQMLTMMIANPAVIKADGGELVEYGVHKAVLKKSGDSGHELTIVMHDKHIVKATCQGLSADELLAVVDQACVDRMEKPLGK
jgi:hypothetical protein